KGTAGGRWQRWPRSGCISLPAGASARRSSLRAARGRADRVQAQRRRARLPVTVQVTLPVEVKVEVKLRVKRGRTLDLDCSLCPSGRRSHSWLAETLVLRGVLRCGRLPVARDA